MYSQYKNYLSKGAINSLLKISSTPTIADTLVDYNLQIINLTLQQGQHKRPKDFCLYTCTLGDREYKNSNFILSRILSEQEPKIGDIINIKRISTSTLSYKECNIIIIKKYLFLKTNCEVVNSLVFVESYEDIMRKKNNNNRESALKVKEESFKIYSSNNYKSNKKKKNNENSRIIILNSDDEIEKHNEDDEIIDMRTIINLSQISTFTKNICLYVKVLRKCSTKNFFNKVTNKNCKLLSFDLIDATGFEMQATLFDDTIDKLGPLIEEGGIYYIKGGYAKVNDKRFSNIKSDYRLIFDYNTQIIKIDQKNDRLFRNQKNHLIGGNNSLLKFSELNNCKKNEIVNCVGYVLQIFPIQKKVSRIGDVVMRRLILGDHSRLKCQFTIWKQFTELNIKVGDILVMRFIRVGTYNNSICLSTIDDSDITLNPVEKIKEIEELKRILINGIDDDTFKYLNDYSNSSTLSIYGSTNNLLENNNFNSNNKENLNTLLNNKNETNLFQNKTIYINDLLKSLKLGADYTQNFNIKATVLEFELNNKYYYLGCPNKLCRKKLIQKEEGEYYCTACDEFFTEPEYYYTLTLRIIDLTGEHSINLFGDIVSSLFGMDAKKYSELIENNDTDKLQEISEKIEYNNFYFSGKANIINYGGRVKKQLFVYKFEREDVIREKKIVLNEIKNYLSKIGKV